MRRCYTLSEYRQFQPKPPFTIGGRYMAVDGRHFLQDAEGLQELEAVSVKWPNTGDLIEVAVTGITGVGTLRSEEVQVVNRQLRERGFRSKPHAAKFARFVNDVRSVLSEMGLTELFTPTLAKFHEGGSDERPICRRARKFILKKRWRAAG
jgi:hypothetical protein